MAGAHPGDVDAVVAHPPGDPGADQVCERPDQHGRPEHHARPATPGSRRRSSSPRWAPGCRRSPAPSGRIPPTGRWRRRCPAPTGEALNRAAHALLLAISRAAFSPGPPVIAAAGMRTGAAQVEPAQRQPVARHAQHRPPGEELVESRLGVQQVPAGSPYSSASPTGVRAVTRGRPARRDPARGVPAHRPAGRRRRRRLDVGGHPLDERMQPVAAAGARGSARVGMITASICGRSLAPPYLDASNARSTVVDAPGDDDPAGQQRGVVHAGERRQRRQLQLDRAHVAPGRADVAGPPAQPRAGGDRVDQVEQRVLGSTADATAGASTSLARRQLDAHRTASPAPTRSGHLGAGADLRARRSAARRSAPASAGGPPRTSAVSPAAPPSLPAESFSSTSAVPADHGPMAVEQRPAGSQRAPEGSSVEPLADEVGDRHRQGPGQLAARPRRPVPKRLAQAQRPAAGRRRRLGRAAAAISRVELGRGSRPARGRAASKRG